MEPLSIIIISSNYPKELNAISGVAIHQLNKELVKKGARLDLICPIPIILTRNKKYKQYKIKNKSLILEGVRVNYIGYLHLPGRILLPISSIIFFLRCLLFIKSAKLHKNHRLIKAHFAIPEGFSAVLLKRTLKLPVITSLMGSDINVYPYKSPILKKMVQMVLNDSDFVIAVSKDLKNKALSICSNSKIEVIYNGIDKRLFSSKKYNKNELKAIYGLENFRYVVGFVGRIERSKGVFDLIQAFKKIIRVMNNTVLCLVGDGLELNNLKKYITRYNLDFYIKIMGAVKHEIIPEIFKTFDVFVLPSHSEGLPNVILEALSMGIPCVASRVGGIPEIINEDNGVLCNAGDISELSNSIIMALNKKWDKTSIINSVKEFDWEKCVESHLELYNRVINRIK